MSELTEAIELLSTAVPVRSYPGTGSLWMGGNGGMADAHFVDWGLARAVAIILNAVHEGRLVECNPLWKGHPDEDHE